MWRPVAIAAAIGLLFGAHLLVTDHPFLGSGTDIIGMEYPLHAFAAARLRAGDLPLWNPYHLGGAPFQAGVHGHLSPSFWTVLLFDPMTDIKVGIVLHMVLACAGGAWWAARRGLSGSAAVMVGVTFGLSGFAMSHLFAGHRRLFFTAAYLPWVVGLIQRAVEQRPRGIALAGLVCGLMVLCGHYQVVFIGMLGTGLYLILDQWRQGGQPSFIRRAARAIAIMGIIAAVGALIAAVQILPMAETTNWSQRAGGGAAFAGQYASAPMNLLTLVWPNLFGNHVEAPFFGPWAYWEALPYLGLVPLVLTAAGLLVLSPREWLPAGLVATLGLLLSLGNATGVFTFFARIIPGADLFRGPGRYVLLTALFGSLLAGQALSRFMRMDGAARSRRLGLLGLIPLASILVAVWIVLQGQGGWARTWHDLAGTPGASDRMTPVDWSNAFSLARADAVRAAVILSVSVALLWLGLRHQRPRITAVALVALAIIDLYGFGHRFLSTGRREQFVWPVSLRNYLQEQAAPGLRLIDDPALVCPGWGAQLGVAHLGGYDIFLYDRYARYVNRAMGRPLDHYLAIVRIDRYGPMLDRLGARSLLSDGPQQTHLEGFEGWSQEGAFDGLELYRNPSPQPRVFLTHASVTLDEDAVYDRLSDRSFRLPEAMLVEDELPSAFRFESPQDRATEAARIILYDPDRVEIDVEAAVAGAMVLSDNWHPGWRATVDGRPVPLARCNAIMRAVPVAAGEHRVVLEFRPLSFTIGGWVSLAAVLTATMLAFWRECRGRPNQNAGRTPADHRDLGETGP